MRPLLKRQPRTWFASVDYDTARRLLMQAVGPYCAYCELPLSNACQVEHKAPKSMRDVDMTAQGVAFRLSQGFPKYELAWENLLPGCPSCNSHKSANPGTADALATLPPNEQLRIANQAAESQGDLPEPDWTILFHRALGTWVWPDRSQDAFGGPELPGDPTYWLFTFAEDGNQLNVVPNAAYIDQQPNPDILRARVGTVIARLGLNVAGDPTSSDLRVARRTRTFASARTSYGWLDGIVAQRRAAGVPPERLLDDAQVQVLLEATRTAIRATGFWSVWEWVFKARLRQAEGAFAGVPEPIRTAFWTQIFLTYRVVLPDGTRVDALAVLPGTDTDRVQWNAPG